MHIPRLVAESRMLAQIWLMDMPDPIAIGIEFDLLMDGIEIGVEHKS